jgi:hypothetical protein
MSGINMSGIAAAYSPLLPSTGAHSNVTAVDTMLIGVPAATNADASNAGVQVSFSPQALAQAKNAQTTKTKQPGALSDEAQKEVQKLKQRDAEVRRHEQAHLAVAGQYARGGPQYTYQRGPDGQMYAIGGEVSIDTSPGRTPEETIAKAEIIRAAAMAPADPSGQDQSVAAAASKMETEARAEIAQENVAQAQGKGSGQETSSVAAAPTKVGTTLAATPAANTVQGTPETATTTSANPVTSASQSTRNTSASQTPTSEISLGKYLPAIAPQAFSIDYRA